MNAPFAGAEQKALPDARGASGISNEADHEVLPLAPLSAFVEAAAPHPTAERRGAADRVQARSLTPALKRFGRAALREGGSGARAWFLAMVSCWWR